MLMKAAVCYEFKKPLVVEEIEIDPPKKGEVRVRVSATAICHSDIHAISGDMGAFGWQPPLVPGHESAGRVETVGEDVTSVKPGDAVVVSLLASCGRCFQCVSGRPYMCQAKWPLNTESRLRNKQGKALTHMARVAGFAEYVVVHESQVVPIPGDMPMDRASLLSCGVITGIGAVVNRAQVRPLSSVVVIGTGGVGLSAVQGAAMISAYPIIAVDISDSKLAAARAFGATHTVRADDKGAVDAVKQLTGGFGAEYVFVTVGSAAAVQQGYLMSGPHSMTVVVGIPPTGATVTLPAGFPGERLVTNSIMGSTRLHTEVPKLVALYKDKRLKLDELITGRYTLADINRAIDLVVKGEALRNVIVFDAVP